MMLKYPLAAGHRLMTAAGCRHISCTSRSGDGATEAFSQCTKKIAARWIRAQHTHVVCAPAMSGHMTGGGVRRYASELLPGLCAEVSSAQQLLDCCDGAA